MQIVGLYHKVAVFRKDFCGIVSTRQQLLAQVLGGNVVAQRRHDQASIKSSVWIPALMNRP